MANHFSQLAKKSRTNGNAEKIAKEQPGKPSLDIYKLGDDVLRQNSKRITKVDESIRKLAREMLQSMYAANLNSYEEGCLSIPGVYLNVVRPSTIKLKFRDEMGRPRKMKADGLLARCIQHEMDHLNGILFVDRVTSKDDLNKELLKEGFNEKDVISIN